MCADGDMLAKVWEMKASSMKWSNLFVGHSRRHRTGPPSPEVVEISQGTQLWLKQSASQALQEMHTGEAIRAPINGDARRTSTGQSGATARQEAKRAKSRDPAVPAMTANCRVCYCRGMRCYGRFNASSAVLHTRISSASSQGPAL